MKLILSAMILLVFTCFAFSQTDTSSTPLNTNTSSLPQISDLITKTPSEIKFSLNNNVLGNEEDQNPSLSDEQLQDNPIKTDKILALERSSPTNEKAEAYDVISKPKEEGFQWKSAIKQSLLFTAIQHSVRISEGKTRRELDGPFIKDYVHSLSNLRGWKDGGKNMTNYVFHPLQGSIYGFIQVQNDPKGRKQTFGKSTTYWKSRLKALGWSAMLSTQFELGPISEASIGNVGYDSNTGMSKLGYVDLVVTPTIGTGFLIGEDIVDRYVLTKLEREIKNKYAKGTLRILLNPTRSFANVLRFKKPWYRDTRDSTNY